MRKGAGYDVHLDRFDVGIRAIVRACLFGQRALISEMGVTPEQKRATVAAASALTRPLRTEAGLFEVLQACPFLLDLALLLLVRYQARMADLADLQEMRP